MLVLGRSPCSCIICPARPESAGRASSTSTPFRFSAGFLVPELVPFPALEEPVESDLDDRPSLLLVRQPRWAEQNVHTPYSHGWMDCVLLPGRGLTPLHRILILPKILLSTGPLTRSATCVTGRTAAVYALKWNDWRPALCRRARPSRARSFRPWTWPDCFRNRVRLSTRR